MKSLAALLLAVAFGLLGALAQAQAPSTDDFVKKVALSDMMEIVSSQVALSKQPDADTKRFAERMIKDHQQTSKELKGLVDSGKVKGKLPPSLDATHQETLDQLKAKNGKDFDHTYDQMQVKVMKKPSRCLINMQRMGITPI